MTVLESYSPSRIPESDEANVVVPSECQHIGHIEALFGVEPSLCY